MSSEDDEDGEAQATANEFYPYNEVKIEGILLILLHLRQHDLTLLRTPSTVDVCGRLTRPPFTFKSIHLQNTHRTYDARTHDGTKGKERAVAHEASADETKWRSHMDTDGYAGDDG